MKIINRPHVGEADKLKISDSGFSIVEILVVVAIIGILAATAIVNIGNNADRDIRQERSRLTTFLREVQNKALAVDTAGIDFSGKRICGFGFSKNGSSTSLVSFYVLSNDLNEDCSSNSISKTYADSRKIETFFLKKDIVISNSFDDIFFLAPNGEVYSNGIALSGSEYKPITLTKNGVSLDVNIYGSGNIIEQ